MRREHHSVSEDLYPYYQDVYDHVLRVSESTDALRDLVSTIVETNLSVRDYRNNQIMKKVTSWAAIIAVPTLITGYYGMNVPYPTSGQTSGVIVSLALIIGCAGALYLVFKRKEWLCRAQPPGAVVSGVRSIEARPARSRQSNPAAAATASGTVAEVEEIGRLRVGGGEAGRQPGEAIGADRPRPPRPRGRAGRVTLSKTGHLAEPATRPDRPARSMPASSTPASVQDLERGRGPVQCGLGTGLQLDRRGGRGRRAGGAPAVGAKARSVWPAVVLPARWPGPASTRTSDDPRVGQRGAERGRITSGEGRDRGGGRATGPEATSAGGAARRGRTSSDGRRRDGGSVPVGAAQAVDELDQPAVDLVDGRHEVARGPRSRRRRCWASCPRCQQAALQPSLEHVLPIGLCEPRRG